MTAPFVVFSGTANPELAVAIARELGQQPGACTVERFPDGELSVRLDEPIRDREIFVVQPTSSPVDEHLVELLAFADACRRAAAGRITAVVPYFGYARGDKRNNERAAIMASLVAGLMQAAGIQHVITVDLHAPQIDGFFHVPVDSLTAVPSLCEAICGELADRTVVVSPDSGRVRMATEYAHRLGTSVVVLLKRRESGSQTRVIQVVGDVRDRPCLIIDDMITTGGTVAESTQALLQAGARQEIVIAATHGLLLPGARERLSHPAVQGIFVTDTVVISHQDWRQLHIVSTAPLLATAIRKILVDGLPVGSPYR